MKITRLSTSVLVLLCILAASLSAQSASPTYAIRNAKIYTLVGSPIESGTVVIEAGRVAAVGSSVSIPPGAQVVDATGLEVYPGLFDAMSTLGLTEIRAVSVTNDMREMGDFNPHLVAATAIHPASELFPVTRANGVTHVVTAPTGSAGSVAGQASLINLAGWTVEEMLVKRSVAMVVIWPTVRPQGFGFGRRARQRPFREAKEQYDEGIEQLEARLDAARHYTLMMESAGAAGSGIERDLKLEAMVSVVRRELPVLVVANTERQLRDAIAFAERQDVHIILVGGRDAWKVKELLAEKDIPLFLRATQNMPSGEDEAYDEAFAAPGMLHAAGVKFAITGFGSAGPNPPSRTIGYEAAMAVPYGLPWEEALKAITISPAEILGVGDELGTIEVGKIANVIVTDGDPLNIQTQMKYLFVNGVLTSMENKHQELYERYRARR
jgi:imidazolonepropionase-like amidohydrolase